MKRVILAFCICLANWCAVDACAQGAPPAPLSVVEAHAREFGEAIASSDVATWRKYWAAHFSPELLAQSDEDNVRLFGEFWDFTRGLDYHSVQDRRPEGITVLYRTRLTADWQGVVFDLEPGVPYRIKSIGWINVKPPPAPMRKLSPKQAGEELAVYMRTLDEADLFSGAVLLAKDGVVVYEAAFGMASKDYDVRNRADTRFNLGSMNKMFTAVAIMQLVERGKLSLDDPLATYLPDFPDAESAKKIRIRHLLSHSAGLGGFFSERYWNQSRDKLVTVDDMLKFVAPDEKLQFEPGTRFRYSNTGMLVLGKVIEVVTGGSYFDYIRKSVYVPAGMADTDSYDLSFVNKNIAVGYDKQYTAHGIVFRNNLFQSLMRGGPLGGGYSTVHDLLIFDRALRANRLVSAASVELLLSPKPEVHSADYGYGFQVEPKLRIAGHSGGFPGINSNLDMFLDSGWTAIVMSNYSWGTWWVQGKMRELVSRSR